MDTFWIITALCFFSGFIAGLVTATKERGFGTGVALGVLLGPLGLIIAICLSSKAAKPVEQASDQRKCPFCAELIKTEAIVCKHCGRDIEPQKTEANPPE